MTFLLHFPTAGDCPFGHIFCSIVSAPFLSAQLIRSYTDFGHAITAIIMHAIVRGVFPEILGIKNTTLCFSISLLISQTTCGRNLIFTHNEE